MRIVKSKHLHIKAVLASAAFFLLQSCQIAKQSDFHGHWWVIEENAGYLEFACWSDTMYVCSPKYGKIYYGRYQVQNRLLVQYHAFTDSIRISGLIQGQWKDSILLVYDESYETCIRLSTNIPSIDQSGRFEGIAERAK